MPSVNWRWRVADMALVGSGTLSVLGLSSLAGTRSTSPWSHTNRGASLAVLSPSAGAMTRTIWSYTPVVRGSGTQQILTPSADAMSRSHSFYYGVVRGLCYWTEGTWTRSMTPPATVTLPNGKTVTIDNYRWVRLNWTTGTVGTVEAKVTIGAVTVPASGYKDDPPIILTGTDEDTAAEITFQLTGPGGSTTPQLIEVLGYYQFYCTEVLG
jgi:hypothetical protein